MERAAIAVQTRSEGSAVKSAAELSTASRQSDEQTRADKRRLVRRSNSRLGRGIAAVLRPGRRPSLATRAAGGSARRKTRSPQR